MQMEDTSWLGIAGIHRLPPGAMARVRAVRVAPLAQPCWRAPALELVSSGPLGAAAGGAEGCRTARRAGQAPVAHPAPAAGGARGGGGGVQAGGRGGPPF